MKKLQKNCLINVMEELIICFQVQELAELLVESHESLRKEVVGAQLLGVTQRDRYFLIQSIQKGWI